MKNRIKRVFRGSGFSPHQIHDTFHYYTRTRHISLLYPINTLNDILCVDISQFVYNPDVILTSGCDLDMSAITPDQQNVLLDKILVERRSHRQFKPEFPPEEDIKGIIHAGLHAPFAAAAMGETENYFREFFLLKKGSKSLRAAASLIFEEVMATASNLERAMERDPELRTYARGFANRLAMIKKMGQVPGVGTAPYFIVVAERKGFPPI